MKTPIKKRACQTTWVDEQGRPHRLEGPAIITDTGTRFWFVEGRLHREKGPAVEYANGDKEYWRNGLRSDVIQRSAPNPLMWVGEFLGGLIQGLISLR